MNSVQFNINNASYRSKMLALDYDHTIVTPKNCRKFPKDVDDWEWFDVSVPEIIKQHYDDGFMIVIFTNQSKQWKHEQIKNAIEILGVPTFVVIATNKSYYKPNIKLFNDFITKNSFEPINYEKSLFIGDALGRKNDFSDSDKVFAENIGIKYHSPETMFMIDSKLELGLGSSMAKLELSCNPEIIIMVGYPGSGKSTIVNEICKRNNNYFHVIGDVHKTVPKIKKVMKEGIKEGKSIVIDATNNSRKKRKEYIDIGNLHGYTITCIYMTTSMSTSYRRNLKRPDDKKVPLVAYHVFNKYFDVPNEDEGFKLIRI